MLKIQNAMVVAVLIFLKHNGLCGWAVSSFQLRSHSITCTNFRARVTPFAQNPIQQTKCRYVTI